MFHKQKNEMLRPHFQVCQTCGTPRTVLDRESYNIHGLSPNGQLMTANINPFALFGVHEVNELGRWIAPDGRSCHCVDPPSTTLPRPLPSPPQKPTAGPIVLEIRTCTQRVVRVPSNATPALLRARGMRRPTVMRLGPSALEAVVNAIQKLPTIAPVAIRTQSLISVANSLSYNQNAVCEDVNETQSVY